MKDKKIIYALLLLSILFTSTKTIDIYLIADGWSNSTGTYVYLEDINDTIIYLSFDFIYHNEIAPHAKDIANFDITGMIDSIKYAFSEKEWFTIDNVDDIQKWEDTSDGNI